MRGHTVQHDYSVPRLNGKDGVVWAKGDVVTLDDDDAAWVNRDRADTLEPVETEPTTPEPEPDAGTEPEEAAPEPEAEVTATTPAAAQVGGKPPRGSGRRRDSAG